MFFFLIPRAWSLSTSLRIYCRSCWRISRRPCFCFCFFLCVALVGRKPRVVSPVQLQGFSIGGDIPRSAVFCFKCWSLCCCHVRPSPLYNACRSCENDSPSRKTHRIARVGGGGGGGRLSVVSRLSSLPPFTVTAHCIDYVP